MERNARAPQFFPDWERNGSMPGENDPSYYKGMIAQCKLKKNPKPKPIQNRKPHGASRGPARKLSIFYWMFASSRARRTMSKPKDPMWLFLRFLYQRPCYLVAPSKASLFSLFWRPEIYNKDGCWWVHIHSESS